jgi:two-component system, LytTR family, response regulator
MTKLTAYIVDDEPLAIQTLKKRLESFPDILCVGEAERMAKAQKEIVELNPDILFLDIQLAEGTGFDLLNAIDYPGKVIFITAFDQYAFRAFEINALDYLLKPVSVERLEQALDKLNQPGERKATEVARFQIDDRILVMIRSYMRFIIIRNILIITAARDYSTVLTREKEEYLVLRSMTEWENRLPQEHFIRVHRSHIVNIDAIDRIRKVSGTAALVYLKGETEPITLSRSYYKTVKNRFV